MLGGNADRRGRRRRRLAAADAPHDMRHDGVAAIGDPGGHHRQLQRRRGDVALADRRVQRIAGPHDLAEAFHLPGGRGNRTAPLAGHLEIELLAQPQPVRHVGDRIDADPAPDLVEEDVARHLQRIGDGDRPVAAAAMAMEGVAAQAQRAAAADARRSVDRPGLQPRQARHHLEGRAGGVLAGQRLVEQGLERIGVHLVPAPLAEAGDELVGVEPGARDEGQDLAVAHVDHDRAGALVLHAFLGEALQVHIERQLDVGPGFALGAAELADHAAMRIDLDLAHPALAAQLAVDRLLHAVLADREVGQAEQRIAVVARLQVVFRHRRDIAEHVAQLHAVGIGAHLPHVGDDARQVGGGEIDLREDVPA